MEQLKKDLKQSEIKYAYCKDVHEKNKANLDMMAIINKLESLKVLINYH